MADVSDVEKALVTLLAGALFPTISYLNGSYEPSSAVATLPGTGGQTGPVTVCLYRGWPVETTLVQDLSAGRAHVSVFPEMGLTRDTTRYPRDWQIVQTGTVTLTATVSGATVTFGGTGGAGQVAGVTYGTGTATPAYAYRLGASDTPATVAAAFGAAIPGASVAGDVLTVPVNPALANVVADATAISELARQTQGLRVSIWAPTPDARDAIGSVIVPAIANVRALALPDGTMTDMLKYSNVFVNDMPARDRVWRRDIRCVTEYATTISQVQPSVLFPGLTLNTVEVGPYFA